MKSVFDKSAKNYNKDFTESEIGKRQRNIVHQYLNDFFDEYYIKNVLDIKLWNRC